MTANFLSVLLEFSCTVFVQLLQQAYAVLVTA